MKEGRINIYSDTQSRPTKGMRMAMVEAQVGDEQKGLDPSTNELCSYVADLLGKEAAVFLPSGTMCNEIAIMVHCRPGDEIYGHLDSHLLRFEAGGAAAIAGANFFPLQGDRGMYTADTLRKAIRENNRYTPTPKLIVVENTTNFGGGAIWSLEDIKAVTEVAKSKGLITHLDGARLMNAVVESGIEAREFAKFFDTAWIDLSKGLGCPIGGVLAGSKDFINKAWDWKQRIGGSLRQSGMLAAAGSYALKNHLPLLKKDHENARRLAQIVNQHESIKLVFSKVETNVVLIDVEETGVSAYAIRDRLEQKGINFGAFSETLIRALTHLDVSSDMIEEAGMVFNSVIDEMMSESSI